MDKRNWYTGQVVQESHLDEAFDSVEASIRNCFLDAGISGITTGLGVTAGGGTKQVVLGTGVAYDTFGRRIYVSAAQTLTLTVDSAGAPITNPSGSNVRWVSVFVKFELDETEPAFDGGGTEVLTKTNESFLVVIKQAAEGPAMSASRPSAEADEVRCADVKLLLGTTTFVSGDIDLDVANLAFTATKEDDSTIGGKTLDAALTAIYQDLDGRLVDVEAAVSLSSDASLLPGPGSGSDFPRRDSTIGTTRQIASYDHLKAFLDVIEYLPRRPRKLVDGLGIDGANVTAAVLTDNEYKTQVPIFSPQDVNSNTPTAALPCLIGRLPCGDDRFLRLYTWEFGFVVTYNAYLVTPDATLQWTRDDGAGTTSDDCSWALTTRTFDAFDNAGMMTTGTPAILWYQQGFGEADTWDFNDWERTGEIGA